MTLPADCPHHEVVIVGGGPAGLPLAVALAGLHPFYRDTAAFRARYAPLAQRLAAFGDTLYALDLRSVADAGIPPVELYRALHHPAGPFRSLDDLPLTFRAGVGADVALFSREAVGGLWNNVPRNLLTLSPAHWMEFALYPIAQWAAETGRNVDPNALIVKRDLVDYYHAVPERFGVTERIHDQHNVTRITPDARGFRVEGERVDTGEVFACTAEFLVYAVGQRCFLRRLGVPGEDLPFVVNHYDQPEEFPGERVVVIGGGRSADWAATELHDAGRDVDYVMRQDASNHWRLINDSRDGLPYYARIAAILESRSPRLRCHYRAAVEGFGESGGVVLRLADGAGITLEADHVILEIGGEVDYSVLQGFPELQLVPKYDRYRFQCMQVVTHPHNYESVDVPKLYPGGYLAAGLTNVVVAMHGTTYAIAGDILQRLRRVGSRGL